MSEHWRDKLERRQFDERTAQSATRRQWERDSPHERRRLSERYRSLVSCLSWLPDTDHPRWTELAALRFGGGSAAARPCAPGDPLVVFYRVEPFSPPRSLGGRAYLALRRVAGNDHIIDWQTEPAGVVPMTLAQAVALQKLFPEILGSAEITVFEEILGRVPHF